MMFHYARTLALLAAMLPCATALPQLISIETGNPSHVLLDLSCDNIRHVTQPSVLSNLISYPSFLLSSAFAPYNHDIAGILPPSLLASYPLPIMPLMSIS
jgi:hypothetical protein